MFFCADDIFVPILFQESQCLKKKTLFYFKPAPSQVMLACPSSQQILKTAFISGSVEVYLTFVITLTKQAERLQRWPGG